VLVVAAGTTLGMMIADAPAVFLGDALVKIKGSRSRACGGGHVRVIGICNSTR
jgi:putative Ca2+/H+ antiporter (TMEM165/GDT1 family)